MADTLTGKSLAEPELASFEMKLYLPKGKGSLKLAFARFGVFQLHIKT